MIDLAFGPDATAVTFHDPRDGRQPDASALELAGVVQALKRIELLHAESLPS